MSVQSLGTSSEKSEYADWTVEALLAYEEYLYDLEHEGYDTWCERDQVLWELNWRKKHEVERKE